MSAFSNEFENKLGDALLRGQNLVIGASQMSWDTPPTFYIGALTATGADGGGEAECTYTNYARVPVVAGLTAFTGTHGTTTGNSSGTGGTFTNAAAILFPEVNVGQGGFSLIGVGIYDAPSGGNRIAYGALSAVVIMQELQAPRFPVAALSIQIDN